MNSSLSALDPCTPPVSGAKPLKPQGSTVSGSTLPKLKWMKAGYVTTV